MKTQHNLKCLFIMILALTLLPQPVFAGLEWETLRELKLKNKALDVTASFDGKLIFTLTPGKIIVYSTVDNRFIDPIPVAASYNRIAYSNEKRLILSAADPAAFEIIKFDQVYDINIANRPFKGAPDAKITLVVFDDYQ